MSTTPKSFSRTKALINLFERKGQRASEGYLRLEALIGASGSYTFQVNANQTALVTETRLRQGDAFIPTKIGFFIRKSATTSDANQAVSVLQTWPNIAVFPTAQDAALEAFYNSRIQITVNSVNLTEFIPTLQFRRVGQAQQGLSFVVASPAGNTYQRSQWEGPDYGFANYEQDICFNGQANNTCQLILPTATTVTADGSTANYAVIMFKGILVQDGAKTVNDRSFKSFELNR